MRLVGTLRALGAAACCSASVASAQYTSPLDGFFTGPVAVSRGTLDYYGYFSLRIQVETGVAQSTNLFAARVSGQVGHVDDKIVGNLELFVAPEEHPEMVVGNDRSGPGCGLSIHDAPLTQATTPGQVLPVLVYHLGYSWGCDETRVAMIGAYPESFAATSFQGAFNLYPRGDPGGIDWTSFEVYLQPIPEPATLALTATGLLAVGLAARRRRA